MMVIYKKSQINLDMNHNLQHIVYSKPYTNTQHTVPGTISVYNFSFLRN